MRAVLFALLVTACSHASESVKLYEHGDYAGAAKAADEGLADHPNDDTLWGMRVRSALALGDGATVAKSYGDYTAKRGDDDKELLRDLAEATLIQAIQSPSSKLKLRAIETIEDIQLEDLSEDVAQAMGDKDDVVQAAASVAVLHGFQQAAQVADDMLHSENASARAIALAGVAKKIGKPALPDIEKAASDHDPRVRAIAVRYLGKYQDKDAVEICTKRLHDPDESVRAAAATALAQIGLGDTPAVAKTALADKSRTVRLAGVAILDDEMKLEALSADPDPVIALEAAIRVKVRRPELAANAVKTAIGSEDWTIRAGAANSLSRAVDNATAITIAKQLATDPEVGVRLAAARALLHAGERDDAKKIFAAALTEIDAAADLSALHDPQGLTALGELTSDPKRTPEQRASAAAAHRTARIVTPALVAALADSSGLVRVEAAASIAALSK
ncbi:MAG: HEAT repeat domain-containing protein [Kofleriaceae bacterium]